MGRFTRIAGLLAFYAFKAGCRSGRVLPIVRVPPRFQVLASGYVSVMSVKFARYSMGVHGPVLAGRDVARTDAQAVREALEQHRGLVLSFRGVAVATPSYLDEIVTLVRGALVNGRADGLILEDIENGDVREALELVLDRHNMAMAALNLADESDEDVQLLGGSAHLRQTLSAAEELGSFRAAELAERLQIKLPALHNRLQSLLAGGAVSRSRDAEPARGGAYLYQTSRFRLRTTATDASRGHRSHGGSPSV